MSLIKREAYLKKKKPTKSIDALLPTSQKCYLIVLSNPGAPLAEKGKGFGLWRSPWLCGLGQITITGCLSQFLYLQTEDGCPMNSPHGAVMRFKYMDTH